MDTIYQEFEFYYTQNAIANPSHTVKQKGVGYDNPDPLSI